MWCVDRVCDHIPGVLAERKVDKKAGGKVDLWANFVVRYMV